MFWIIVMVKYKIVFKHIFKQLQFSWLQYHRTVRYPNDWKPRIFEFSYFIFFPGVGASAPLCVDNATQASPLYVQRYITYHLGEKEKRIKNKWDVKSEWEEHHWWKETGV